MRVDVHLIRAWTERAMDTRRPVLRHWGVRPDEAEQAALGSGFAAIRAAVLGEQLRPADPSGPGPAVDLERYLHGVAAGIEATGADPEPMSLVAGLVAGAAQLQFSRAGVAGSEHGAAEAAARAGVAAADLATEGGGLARITEAAAGVITAGPLRPPQDPELADDHRLRALIAIVLAALAEVTRAGDGADPDAGTAGCGAGPGDHAGRTFLAEVTFSFHGDPAAQVAVADALERMGTDLRVWPGEPDPAAAEGSAGTRYHLHTRHPAEVVAEVYAAGTPFDLRIGTLEPPLDVADPDDPEWDAE